MNHILPSKKSLNRHHKMEYHVIRLVVVLHDGPVGKDVTSEQAMRRRLSAVCLSFRSLSIPSRPEFMTVKELFTVNQNINAFIPVVYWVCGKAVLPCNRHLKVFPIMIKLN